MIEHEKQKEQQIKTKESKKIVPQVFITSASVRGADFWLHIWIHLSRPFQGYAWWPIWLRLELIRPIETTPRNSITWEIALATTVHGCWERMWEQPTASRCLHQLRCIGCGAPDRGPLVGRLQSFCRRAPELIVGSALACC